MAFPDHPSRSGEESDGRRSGRHRARHADDAAPDPYEELPWTGQGEADPDPYWPGGEDLPWAGNGRAGRHGHLDDDTWHGETWADGRHDQPRYDEPRYDPPYPRRDDDTWAGGALPPYQEKPWEEPTGDLPVVGRSRADRRRAEEAEAPKASRAGRNLPAAIGIGLLLGAVVLGSLLYWRPAFLGVIVAAIAVGMWETARAVRASGAHPPLPPLLAGGVVMAGLAWYGGPEALCLGLLLTVLATMIWRLADGPERYHRDIGAATLVAVYVPFLGGFAALLAAPAADGDLRLLAALVAVVLSDTGGYIAGVIFGRHPMAPSVSPKKSWEGFAGSLVATAAGSAVLLYYAFDVLPWWGAVFGLALAVAAVLGDLAESMIKRDLGIKDMSSLLPGHGGLMDRLDSVLFALPVAYLLLSWLAVAPR